MAPFLLGLTDSLPAGGDNAERPCPHGHASARVARGLCLGCLLQAGTDDEPEELSSADFDAALAAVAISDTSWRIGNYEILEEIGRGGMGVIYRARQRHTRRIVALKRVLGYHADSRETLARFRREAEAAASLDHPHILPIYEVGESEEGVPFFSMKYASGGSLQEVGPSLRDDPREIVRLIAKVTRAVQFAHRQGILHRDLKPGNILLDGRGEPLVSDFGLAKWLDTSSDLTRTLTIFGTPGYIAPEQAKGTAASLKPSADIYSLGALLFGLLAGRPPFLGEHALAVIHQAAEKAAPKLRSLARGADRDLETICGRCLEREPASRYQSAGDLAEDLERWLEGRPIIARPVPFPVRAWRWSRRNPALAASLSACLALTVVAGIRWVHSSNLEAAGRQSELASHSIAVVPALDLDSVAEDKGLTTTLAEALGTTFGNFGPGRAVAALDQNAERASYGNRSALTATAQAARARATLIATRRLLNGKHRVSLRLVDTQGELLWSGMVNAEGTSPLVAAIHQSVARNIYDCLHGNQSAADRRATTDPGRQDGYVRDLILAGKALIDARANSNVDRALDCFQKAIELAPQSAWANASYAGAVAMKLHFQPDAGLLRKAEDAAHRAIELEPNSPDAHRAAGALYFQMGRFPSAIEEGYIAIELAGVEERVSAELGQILKTTGRPDKAIRWFEIAVQSEGRPADLIFVLGDCWADLCDDEKAEAIYRRVSQLRPDIPDGWIGISRLRLLNQNFPAAREICRQNQRRQGGFDYTNEIAAQVEFFARNFPAAGQLYQDLSKSNPGGGGSFYGALSYQSVLGYLLLRAGDPSGKVALQQALATEQQALLVAPDHPEIFYRLAAIESCLGNVPSALKHLRAATAAGWLDYRSLSLDPRFDNVAGEPEFQQIVKDQKTQVQLMRRQLVSRTVGPS